MPEISNLSSKNNLLKESEEWLRPAFASNAGAVGFLALVIFSLMLPWIITKSELISPRSSYEMMPEHMGEYSFVKDEVFDKQEDIDILFIGASVIWSGIDTPLVQKELSDKLGRPARVVTFGFNYSAFDIPYTFIYDLLERRRVRLVVFSIPRDTIGEGPSVPACKFLRYDRNKEVVDGLPLESKLSLYACNVLRSSQDLLALMRQNRSKPSKYTDNLGMNKEALGMFQNPKTFQKFIPPSPVFTSESLFLSNSNYDRFTFTNEKFNVHQDHYLHKMIELLTAKKVPLVMLNFPQYSERQSDKVIEYHEWSKKFGVDAPLVGIPPTVLFDGLSEEEIEKLYKDDAHFNINGSEFYTRTILPSILELYEKHNAKNH